MLLGEALVHVLKLWDNEKLVELPTDMTIMRIPLLTLQILVRTLSAQSAHGSWENSPEITAYALLTVKRLASLPWIRPLRTKIDESIGLGTILLQSKHNEWNTPSLIWIEKVTYGSNVLSETYCIAALYASHNPTWGGKSSSLFSVSPEVLEKFSQFFSKLPIFAMEPRWRLQASIIEGGMFAPGLCHPDPELDIFSKTGASERYLEYIPFTWTLCNNATEFGMSTQAMEDMMVISMLNFQVDKYMEDITADKRLGGDFGALKNIVDGLKKRRLRTS